MRRGDPDSSATSPVVLDSFDSTPTVRGQAHALPPLRSPSKDIPFPVMFRGRYPFTEEVGPTKILAASANAIDFFMQMLDHDLMEHNYSHTNKLVC